VLTAGAVAAIGAWAPLHHRDLPWRATRDRWAVLVSEVMLQQTQVDRVVPRWESFMARFATPAAAAAAGVAAVVDEWAGLGYNRRAVSLHRCAVMCVADHGGDVPGSLEQLLALPGVGPYTARAVLAFADGADVGVVDTNVGRVLARVAGRRLRPAEAQRAADEAVPEGAGWWWNQAMLDLGATVCTARAARCGQCPVAPWCAWRGEGPDPAAGSAGVTVAQSRFEGSDRQGRGLLVDALRTDGVVAADAVASVAGWPGDPDRARRVAAGLVADGLAGDDGSGGLVRPA
jgi:A/G-specific adenine glycosylase